MRQSTACKNTSCCDVAMLRCCYPDEYEVALIGAISVTFEGTKLRFVGHEVVVQFYSHHLTK